MGLIFVVERNPYFGGKIGLAASVAPKDLGPRDPTKKLALDGWNFWVLCNILKTCFQNFRA